MSDFVTAYEERVDEDERVRAWHLGRLLELGYPVDVAESLASRTPTGHTIAGLIAAG